MSNDTTRRYTASLDTGLQALYGMNSRADDAADISRQVLGINDTIRDLAQRHLDPLLPLTDFKSAMLALQDDSNTCGKAS